MTPFEGAAPSRDAPLVDRDPNGQNMVFAASIRTRRPMTGARLLLRLAVACAFAGGMPLAAAASQSKPDSRVYKWVDEKGVTHYGDAVPPRYAGQDKTVLNSQGVSVGSIPGRRTPEQLETEARRRAEEDRARQDVVLARQRDQNLLATYLTVEEIEALRDRRVEILDAQARVTTQYLEQVSSQLKNLETQARRFRPYAKDANAPAIPEHLAADLVRAVGEIGVQERNLQLKKEETERLKAQFARDIARFRELKKIETEYARGAQPR